MEITEKLFENIVIVGKSDDKSSIFDEIETQEAKMAENKDLYDAHDKITKVYGQLFQNGEIQTMAPAIDVNKGILKVDGITKDDVAADGSKYTPDEVVDMFTAKLAEVIPDNLDVTFETGEGDELPKMGKQKFTIVISRKG